MPASNFAQASTARLVGLLVIGVLFLAGIGLFGTQFAHDEGARAINSALTSSALLDEARTAQVTFKIQVQHWKNLLLRGHTASDYERYLAQFGKDERAVDDILRTLADSPELPANLKTEVQAIRTEHESLGVSYREAIKQFRPNDAASTFAVDASVRGIDQKLTERIDTVAGQILEAEKSHASAVRTEFDRRYHTLRTTVTIATAAVLLLLGILVWRSRPGAR